MADSPRHGGDRLRHDRQRRRSCNPLDATDCSTARSPPRSTRWTPTIAGATVPAANAAGWNKGNVTVDLTCADTGGSGIQSCTADAAVAGETDGTPKRGTAVDKAGNVSAPGTVNVKIDKTKPTIAAAGPANGAWTNANVTVPFPCADPGPVASGVNGRVPNRRHHDRGRRPDRHRDGERQGREHLEPGHQPRVQDRQDRPGDHDHPAGRHVRPQPGRGVELQVHRRPLRGRRRCAGPVANGAAFDTSQGGTNQTFTVNATDKAGNTATKAVTYRDQARRPGAGQPGRQGDHQQQAARVPLEQLGRIPGLQVRGLRQGREDRDGHQPGAGRPERLHADHRPRRSTPRSTGSSGPTARTRPSRRRTPCTARSPSTPACPTRRR